MEIDKRDWVKKKQKKTTFFVMLVRSKMVHPSEMSVDRDGGRFTYPLSRLSVDQ